MKTVLYFLLILSFPVLGQSDSLFEQGNSAYNAGNYEVAVSSYQKILNNKEASAEVYFNLGNAHYKLNHIPESVYYYEKALQLKPGNKDFKNNLEFANNMVLDDIKTTPETGISGIGKSFVNAFGFNGWAWMAIIFAFIMATLFLLYYFSIAPKLKRIFFTASIICLLIAILSVSLGFIQKSDVENTSFAIVFSPETTVRNEPNTRADEVFSLHEGSKVKVVSTFQNWVEIQLANGAKGWMDKSEVKFL